MTAEVKVEEKQVESEVVIAAAVTPVEEETTVKAVVEEKETKAEEDESKKLKKGGIRKDSRVTSAAPIEKIEKVERKLTVESLGLEPLCDEIQEYFAARKISAETLARNRVMQKRLGDDEIVIAFTYWQRGELVSCKYRSLSKKFSQERNTRRIFYGLDDFEKASEIIIVEGEIDKLAMEEAGFRNCVSVPDGAPASVSSKETPPEEKDTKYKFLWNCNDYLKKASRIIIATDGDGPGLALAEEVARRLGKERCWRVKWPKKGENAHFKDANEVLMALGPHSLNEAVQNAEPYPIQGGSAHFINKCDNGIVIHRNRDENVGPLDLVQICVRKVRNKVEGQIGDAYLRYDRATGVYSDCNVTPLTSERRSKKRS